jgi:ribulose 1,5-bisphosphate synthetase/thiazole synthase
MSSTEVQDLIVIGGGTSGIAAARFYLDVHPKRKVTVIERDGAVGGVWSKGMALVGFDVVRLMIGLQRGYTMGSSPKAARD